MASCRQFALFPHALYHGLAARLDQTSAPSRVENHTYRLLTSNVFCQARQSMTLFYYSPLFLQHDTGQHPERPERLTQVVRHCERTGLLDECQRRAWQAVSPE